MLVPRLPFLMIFGFGFGCLGLQNQAFVIGGIAKINFRRGRISYDSRVHFHDFECPWTNFHDFCCPGDKLEI